MKASSDLTEPVEVTTSEASADKSSGESFQTETGRSPIPSSESVPRNAETISQESGGDFPEFFDHPTKNKDFKGYLSKIGWIGSVIFLCVILMILVLCTRPCGETNRYRPKSDETKFWLSRVEQESNEIPKIIWMFWDKPDRAKRPKLVNLCEDRARELHENSGWEVRFLDEENVTDWVEQEFWDFVLDEAKAPHRFYAGASDYLRMYLLKKHGGVWMDASVLVLRPLDWIYDIPNNPELVMFWNNQVYSQHYVEEWDPCAHKYPRWSETWFLAAPKGSRTIQDWLNELHKAFMYNSTVDYLIAQGITTDIRTAQDLDYFVAYTVFQVILDRDRTPASTRNIAYLHCGLDGYRYKNQVTTSNTWNWQMDLHGKKAVDNLLDNPDSVVVDGARMFKFDKTLREIVEKDPANLEKLRRIVLDPKRLQLPEDKPAYLECTRPQKSSPARQQVKALTKWNYKIWSPAANVTDKQFFFRYRNWIGGAGLIFVIALLGWFVYHRISRPIELKLRYNRWVRYTTWFQATLFLASFVMGWIDRRTVTQGGQIIILVYYITDVNVLLAVWLPFSIMALVYGFQNDALKAGFCLLIHMMGTGFVYISAPAGVSVMFWRAWDAYCLTACTVAYIQAFIQTPREYYEPESRENEQVFDDPDEEV